MHPLLVGRLRPTLYMAVWLVIGFGLSFMLSRYQPRSLGQALAFMGPLTLIYASMCLSAWWLVKSNPIGTTPAVRLIPTLVMACLQSAAILVVLAAVLGAFLSARFGVGDRQMIIRDLLFVGISGLVLYAESIAIHYVLLALENSRAIERRLLESQVTAREAELRALRAQLNPHFLFNSLNSISALTGPDPEAARRMCQLLGDFLRLSLSIGARERVLFKEELGLAEQYLSIEQVRFGARLGFEKRIEPGAERCFVPPLLIQPLVENAVKHGVADRVEGGVVRIEARRLGPLLEIVVENPRDPEAPPRRGHGLGLQNVRQRLIALDPKETRVEIHPGVDSFRVVLRLPAEEAPIPAAPQPVAASASARAGEDDDDE